MSSSVTSSRALVGALLAATVTGCSSMQPTPTMPTYPAQIGGGSGVTADLDYRCRQQANAAAEKTKQDNVTKEVAVTAISTVAGAVIGNQLNGGGAGGRGLGGMGGMGGGGPGPRGHGGGGPGGRGGPGGPGGGHGHGGHDLAGAGALAGAATGAALSQSMLQDTQQTFDIVYNNCIEANRSHYSSSKKSRKRRSRR